MAIIKCEFPRTQGLEKELEVLSLTEEGFNSLTDFNSPQEKVNSWIIPHHRVEVEKIRDQLKPASRVLDIGAGSGHTSILFAMAGHHVTAVEPSLEYCKVIEALVDKFSLPIQIYQSTGEHLETNNEFDACVFNASLHHCDEPQTAINKCYSFLVPGGSIYLVNEPVLKFFRSKQWYDNIRASDPESVGDYGGNEHIYRHHEYIRMLGKAGFKEISASLPDSYLNPRAAIRTVLNARLNSRYVYSDIRVLLRAAWYFAVSKVVQFRPILHLMQSLSLINSTFKGNK